MSIITRQDINQLTENQNQANVLRNETQLNFQQACVIAQAHSGATSVLSPLIDLAKESTRTTCAYCQTVQAVSQARRAKLESL